MIAAPELLDHAHGDAFIADTGYDSNDFRAELKTHAAGTGLALRACFSSVRERARSARAWRPVDAGA